MTPSPFVGRWASPHRLYAEYRMLRDDFGMSRRKALWDLRPTRIRAIFALIHGNPVAFRLDINKDGSVLVFEPGIHGAVITECTIHGPAGKPGVYETTL